MKLKNLVVLICMLFLLNISLAYAVDINPVIELSASSTNVRDTVQLEVKAVDVMTNAGILWIRLYEGTTLLKEKNCGGLTTCVLVREVSHANSGVYTYYAAAKDKGANRAESNRVTVTFQGNLPPQYSNIVVNPASPVTYDPAQVYEFNISWTDDYNKISTVQIEHNFTGTLTNYPATNAGGDVYTYTYTGLNAGNYTYRWYASDAAGHTNATAVQTYTVNQAPVTLNLTVDPSWNVVGGTQTNVSCSANNTAVLVILRRDGSSRPNPDVQTLIAGIYLYECATAGNPNYEFAQLFNNLTVTSKNPSTCSLTFNPVSPTSYTIPVNASCFCTNPEANAILWRNGTDVTATENNQAIVLAAGTYGYICNVSETANYSSASNSSSYIVNKALSVVNLLLNGINGNITVFVNETINVTGTLIAGEENLSLYENFIPIYSSASPLVYNLSYSSPTAVNITLIHPDTQNYSSNDETFVVTVIPVPTNNAPVFDTLAVNTSIQVNNLFTYDVNASDADVGDILTYSDNATQFDINASTGLINFTPTVVEVITATITVCDDSGAVNNCTTQPFSLNVTPTGGIPTTGNVVINELMIIPASGNDWVELYNNDTVSINVTGWILNDSSSSTAMATLNGALNPGAFLYVEVSNRLTDSGEDIILMNSTGAVMDSYTYATAQLNITIGRYPDGANNWFNLTTPTPNTSNIYAPSVYVAWNQSVLDLGSVVQGSGNLTDSANITATGNNTNVTVVCSSGNCTEITDNWVDGTNMTNGESQAVTFTCSDSTVGNYSTVFDVTSDEYSIAYQINVSCEVTAPTNNAPYFTTPAVNASVQNNTLFTFDVNAADLDVGDNLTFSDNAARFDINASTGLINFTPVVVEVITATITVCDDSGFPNNCTTQPFNLNVTPGPTNNAPYFTTPAVNASVQNNTLFTFDVNAADLDIGDVLTYSDNAAQFDINSSTGLINFTPVVVEVITATITVCDDSGFPNNCTTHPFSLNVTPGPIYGVSLTDPTDQTVNNATNAVYSLTLTNTGNVPDNFTLAVNNIDNATTATLSQYNLNNLAAGASNSITLTVGDSTPGNYTVNVTATSVHGPSAEVSVTTQISAIPTYGVNVSDPTGQTIDTATNAVYTITVTNTGNGIDSFDLTVNNLNNATTAVLNTSTITNLNPSASANVTLTVGDSTAGEYNVTVTAVSQANASDTDTTAVITTTIVQAPGGFAGIVKNNFNNPLLNVNVSVFSTSLFGLTDAAGAYAIANVNAGTYSVTATPPDDSHLAQTKSGQVVNPGATTTVNFVLTQTGIINGTVYEFFNPTITISSATVTARIGVTVYGTDVTDINGDYEITGLPPGIYDVYVSHPSYVNIVKPLNDLLSGEIITLDFYMWT